jgi:DNA-binding Lrp family transcriptional regulator|tara:strand:- start:78 stop:455 length:378 start_codon:yes stop_codon:yes gene_type:complete
MARQLTEKQQKFLDVLFEEARGSVVEAKKLAGYSPTQYTASIVESLKDEILERTNMYLAQNGPRAAMAMVGALHDPTELGIKEKMQAAKEVMDRIGIIKSEKVQIESTGGVMLLPPKKSEDDEQE